MGAHTRTSWMAGPNPSYLRAPNPAYIHWVLGLPQPVSNVETHTTRNFAGLLRSCRALYVKTTALLYSANRFVIFYSHHGSF
jgi:hypothetical protein